MGCRSTGHQILLRDHGGSDCDTQELSPFVALGMDEEPLGIEFRASYPTLGPPRLVQKMTDMLASLRGPFHPPPREASALVVPFRPVSTSLRALGFSF